MTPNSTADASRFFGPRRQWRWHETIILLFLIYNAFAASTLYRVPGLWFVGVTQPLYFLVIVVWLSSLLRNRRPFPETGIDLLVGLLSVLFLFSVLVSVDLRLSLNDVTLYFSYLMFFYLFVDRLRAGWPVSIFLKALMMLSALVFLLGIIEFLLWYFWGSFSNGPSWWSIGGWQNPVPLKLRRLSVTLFNPNLIGLLQAVVLPLWLAAVIIVQGRLLRVIMVVATLASGLVLMLSLSKSALLGSVLALLFFGLLLSTKYNFSRISVWLSRHWLIVVLVGVAIVSGLLAVGSVVLDSLNRSDSYTIRRQLWGNTLRLITDHPWLGTGPDTFGMAIMTYWDPTQIFFAYVQAHNMPLHLAAELGIPAMVLMGGITGLVLYFGYKQFTQLSYEQSVLMAGVMAGIVAFIGQSLADSLIETPSIIIPMLILAAISAHKPIRFKVPVVIFTPVRALILTIAIGGWLAWSLYGLSKFEKVSLLAAHQQWNAAIDELEALPVLTLPTTFLDFERGMFYGKLALQHQNNETARLAISKYKHGLAQTPMYLPGRANLAALYLQTGNHLDAERELQSLVAIAGETTAVMFYRLNLGYLYEQQQKNKEAVNIYGQILAANPVLAESLYWQESPWRQEYWLEIVKAAELQLENNNDAATTSFNKGLIAYYSGNLDQAASFFQSSNTESLDTQLWLTQILVDQNKFGQAATSLNEILTSSAGRQLSKPYLLRGRVNLALGNQEAGFKDLEVARFLGNRETLFYAGNYFLNQGNVNLAASLFQNYVGNSSELQGFHHHYDFMIYRMRTRLDIPYQNVLLPVVKLPPTRSEAQTYFLLADWYVQHGNIELARSVYYQLLTKSPEYKPALERLESLPQ